MAARPHQIQVVHKLVLFGHPYKSCDKVTGEEP